MFCFIFEGRDSVRAGNVSWDRVPDSGGFLKIFFLLKLEGTLAKRLGVCSRKPFFSGSERAGRSIGGEKRRQVRRKSAFETAKTEGGNLVSCTVFMVISLTINFTSITFSTFSVSFLYF